MKKLILVFIICLILCGCSRKMIIEFPVYSTEDKFSYGNINIQINSISDETCSQNAACSKYKTYTVDVNAGPKNSKRDYTLYVMQKKEYYKIYGTKQYIYATIKNNRIVVGIAK